MQVVTNSFVSWHLKSNPAFFLGQTRLNQFVFWKFFISCLKKTVFVFEQIVLSLVLEKHFYPLSGSQTVIYGKGG